MRRFAISAAVCSLAILASGAAAGDAGAAIAPCVPTWVPVVECGAANPADLLPNLLPEPATQVSLVTDGATKELQFTTAIENRGPGPVEIVPGAPAIGDCNGDGDPTDDRLAYQRIYQDADHDGQFTRGVDVETRAVQVGCISYHEAHHHFHFQRFAQYALLRRDDGVTVALTDKVGFCLADVLHIVDPPPPGVSLAPYYPTSTVPPGQPTLCTDTAAQGISPGWRDIYPADVPGQTLDVTGLVAGRYCLVERIDPPGQLTESVTSDDVAVEGIILKTDDHAQGVPEDPVCARYGRS